ncbi:MAG: hypothetical protein H0U75_07900 [Legionella sp.]|nr:hypothetical protein [Legionella sp.]
MPAKKIHIVLQFILFALLCIEIQPLMAFHRLQCAPLNTCVCEKYKVAGFAINHYGCGLLCQSYHSVVQTYHDNMKQDLYCNHLK